MQDLVTPVTAFVAAVAMLYFLLEFQFPRAKDRLAAGLRRLVRR